MQETIEQKQARLDKLRAKEQELLAKAKQVKQRIARAESAEKAKRKKQDDRSKLVLGVAILHAAKKDPRVLATLQEAARWLPQKDRDFLEGESALWAEVQTNSAAMPAAA